MITPQSFKNEAMELINYFNGFIPKERNWREEILKFFETKNIDEIHWDTIYYEALTIENN